MKNLYKIEDELYIISNNEAINENDHIITQDGRLVEVSYLLSKDVQGGHKVILTTNKLLIKDGVQAIDDEFLEWFVKNPSCKFVEVKDNRIWYDVEAEKLRQKNGIMGNFPLFKTYKIIIPKEEPKHPKVLSENGNELFFDEQGNLIKEEPKQETLEEFIKRQVVLGKYQDQETAIAESMKIGIQWQQERSYSEEEVDNLCELIKQNERQWDLFDKNIVKIKPKGYYEIIEEFKKK